MENQTVFQFFTALFREKILFPKFWKARGMAIGKRKNPESSRSMDLGNDGFSTWPRKREGLFREGNLGRYLMYERSRSPYIYIVGFAGRPAMQRVRRGGHGAARARPFSALSLLNKEKTLYFFLMRGILIRLFIKGLWFLTVKGSRYEAHLSAE